MAAEEAVLFLEQVQAAPGDQAEEPGALAHLREALQHQQTMAATLARSYKGLLVGHIHQIVAVAVEQVG